MAEIELFEFAMLVGKNSDKLPVFSNDMWNGSDQTLFK